MTAYATHGNQGSFVARHIFATGHLSHTTRIGGFLNPSHSQSAQCGINKQIGDAVTSEIDHVVMTSDELLTEHGVSKEWAAAVRAAVRSERRG